MFLGLAALGLALHAACSTAPECGDYAACDGV